VADLSSIPARLFASPWHRGDNDRSTAYLGAEHAFGSAERVERWLARAEKQPGLGRNWVQQGGQEAIDGAAEITRRVEELDIRLADEAERKRAMKNG
jgi:hypothetical protein